MLAAGQGDFSFTRREFLAGMALVAARSRSGSSGSATKTDAPSAVTQTIPGHALTIRELSEALVLTGLSKATTDEEKQVLNYYIDALPSTSRYNSDEEGLIDIKAAMERAYRTTLDVERLPTSWGEITLKQYGLPDELYCKEGWRPNSERQQVDFVSQADGEEAVYYTSEGECAYDDEDRLTLFAKHPEPTSTLRPEVIDQYTYDGRGRCTKVGNAMGCKSSGGGMFYRIHCTFDEFDDEGKTSSSRVSYESDKPEFVDSWTDDDDMSGYGYEYADEGYLLVERWRTTSKYAKNKEKRTEYCRSFDKKGRPTRVEVHDSSGDVSYSAVIKFDEHDRPTYWLCCKGAYVDGDEADCCEVEYDHDGRVTRCHVWKEGSEYESDTRYKYLTKYHLIAEECLEDGTITGVCVRQYDSAGRFAFLMHGGSYLGDDDTIIVRDSQGRARHKEEWARINGTWTVGKRVSHAYSEDTGMLSMMAIASTEYASEDVSASWDRFKVEYGKSVHTFGYRNKDTGEEITPGDPSEGMDISLDADALLCPHHDTWPVKDVFKAWTSGSYPYQDSLAFADGLVEE